MKSKDKPFRGKCDWIEEFSHNSSCEIFCKFMWFYFPVDDLLKIYIFAQLMFVCHWLGDKSSLRLKWPGLDLSKISEIFFEIFLKICPKYLIYLLKYSLRFVQNIWNICWNILKDVSKIFIYLCGWCLLATDWEINHHCGSSGVV